MVLIPYWYPQDDLTRRGLLMAYETNKEFNNNLVIWQVFIWLFVQVLFTHLTNNRSPIFQLKDFDFMCINND